MTSPREQNDVPHPAVSLSDQSIRKGQVWDHHTTGRYTVVEVRPGGRVALRQGSAPTWVWSDYMRENFSLVSEGADQ